MNTLDQDIEYLEELHRARAEARELRTTGIAALLPHVARPADKRVRWDDSEDVYRPGSTASRIVPVLLRRVKHLAWMLDEPRDKEIHDDDVLPLPELTLDQLFHDDPTDIPVYFAAHYLRTALDEDAGYIGKPILLCYYRVLRELYFVNPPDWAMGGARAGEYAHGTADASAFVTNECARALNGLRRKLVNTADYLARVRKAIAYFEHVQACGGEGAFAQLHQDWCDQETQRVSLELRVRSAEASSSTLLKLRVHKATAPAVEDFRELVEEIRRSVARFLAGTYQAFERAIVEIQRFRKGEELAAQRHANNHEAPEHVIGFRLFRESESAHGRALDSFFPAQTLLRDVLEKERGTLEFFEAVARCCERTARGLAEMLEPTQSYVESVCRRAVVEYDASGSIADAPELAFAAACYGALARNWRDPIYRRIIKVLSASLDGRGRFPAGRPFHFGDQGAQLNPINAHVVRAFVEILGHVPGDVDAGWFQRVVRYLRDELVDLGEGHRAWGRGRAVRRRFPAIWVTAVTTLSLHRTVTMLNHKINECVHKHFAVRNPAAISAPLLDDLMGTDVGLARVTAGARSATGKSITADLTLMLAHLLGPRAVKVTDHEDVYSVVMYGPPGTGKTSLIESLARTAERPIISVSPSDFIVQGAERLEKRAADVMRALSMLTDCVILFDEFDAVLYARADAAEPPDSVFAFLSGCMLPKIKALRESAERNRVVYALATNYFERLDDAAVRPGRFDYRVGVFPPDPQSRLCRLVSQFRMWCASNSIALVDATRGKRRTAGRLRTLSASDLRELEQRMAVIVSHTAGVPVVELCKRGWFSMPRGTTAPPRTAWSYLLGGLLDAKKVDWKTIPWPLPAKRHDFRAVTSLYEKKVLADVDEKERCAAFESDLVLKQVAGTRIVEHWNNAVMDFVDGNATEWSRGPWAEFVECLADQGPAKEEVERLELHLEWMRMHRLQRDEYKRRSMTPSAPGKAADDRRSASPATPANRRRTPQRTHKKAPATDG